MYMYKYICRTGILITETNSDAYMHDFVKLFYHRSNDLMSIESVSILCLTQMSQIICHVNSRIKRRIIHEISTVSVYLINIK